MADLYTANNRYLAEAAISDQSTFEGAVYFASRIHNQAAALIETSSDSKYIAFFKE